MKQLIAVASFALLGTPALAQSFDRSPTDPIMPSAVYDPTAPVMDRQIDRNAAAGTTRSGLDVSAERRRAAEADYADRHVEQRRGYFDSGE